MDGPARNTRGSFAPERTSTTVEADISLACGFQPGTCGRGREAFEAGSGPPAGGRRFGESGATDRVRCGRNRQRRRGRQTGCRARAQFGACTGRGCRVPNLAQLDTVERRPVRRPRLIGERQLALSARAGLHNLERFDSAVELHGGLSRKPDSLPAHVLQLATGSRMKGTRQAREVSRQRSRSAAMRRADIGMGTRWTCTPATGIHLGPRGTGQVDVADRNRDWDSSQFQMLAAELHALASKAAARAKRSACFGGSGRACAQRGQRRYRRVRWAIVVATSHRTRPPSAESDTRAGHDRESLRGCGLLVRGDRRFVAGGRAASARLTFRGTRGEMPDRTWAEEDSR